MSHLLPNPDVRILALVLIILLAACDSSSTDPEEGNTPKAQIYLSTALNIMQTHSIRKYEVDWPPLRAKALEMAKNAVTTADTYDAIRYVLTALGDNHSAFYPPEPGGQSEAVFSVGPTPALTQLQNAAPHGERLESRTGYVWMPSFSSRGLSTVEIVEHATSYHTIIRQTDTTGMCGWIVDLRSNGGGNMWPMLAGIGPILGKGMVGQFVDPDLNTTYWYYQTGKSMSGSYVVVEVDGTPYELIDPDPAVAVLTGRRTASSGEAQVVAFRGRPDTRSFGEPTHGVPTANQGFPLSDGALLNLTVAWMADRTGQTYDSPLPPDVPIPGDPTWEPATDPVVQAAEAWVLQAGACSGG